MIHCDDCGQALGPDEIPNGICGKCCEDPPDDSITAEARRRLGLTSEPVAPYGESDTWPASTDEFKRRYLPELDEGA